jgi:hypothetical protein
LNEIYQNDGSGRAEVLSIDLAPQKRIGNYLFYHIYGRTKNKTRLQQYFRLCCPSFQGDHPLGIYFISIFSQVVSTHPGKYNLSGGLITSDKPGNSGGASGRPKFK